MGNLQLEFHKSILFSLQYFEIFRNMRLFLDISSSESLFHYFPQCQNAQNCPTFKNLDVIPVN